MRYCSNCGLLLNNKARFSLCCICLQMSTKITTKTIQRSNGRLKQSKYRETRKAHDKQKNNVSD